MSDINDNIAKTVAKIIAAQCIENKKTTTEDIESIIGNYSHDYPFLTTALIEAGMKDVQNDMKVYQNISLNSQALTHMNKIVENDLLSIGANCGDANHVKTKCDDIFKIVQHITIRMCALNSRTLDQSMFSHLSEELKNKLSTQAVTKVDTGFALQPWLTEQPPLPMPINNETEAPAQVRTENPPSSPKPLTPLPNGSEQGDQGGNKKKKKGKGKKKKKKKNSSIGGDENSGSNTEVVKYMTKSSAEEEGRQVLDMALTTFESLNNGNSDDMFAMDVSVIEHTLYQLDSALDAENPNFDQVPIIIDNLMGVIGTLAKARGALAEALK